MSQLIAAATELAVWNPEIARHNQSARTIALEAVREGPITANTYKHGANVEETIRRTTEWVQGDRRAAIYGSRINNPTLSALEDALACYEPGTAIAAVTSCGERAVVETLMGSLIHGERVLASTRLFGGTLSFLNNEMRDGMGIGVDFVNDFDPQKFKDALTPKTRAIIIEGATNPRLDLMDIAALGKIARSHNVLLIVDQSMTTALPLPALALGAHIVMESMTKTISNGHGNAGIIKISQEGWEMMHRHDVERQKLNPAYAIKTDPSVPKNRIISSLMRADSLSPDTAYHLLEKIAGQRAIFERGTLRAASTTNGAKPVDFIPIPDYAETFRRYSDNARHIADALSAKGIRVLHPGLEDTPKNEHLHQQFLLARRELAKRNDGAAIGGPAFGIDFGYGPESEKQALAAVNKLIAYGWSPETNFAQPVPNATPQRRVTFGALSDAQCREVGISDGFVRFSGGLIDPGYAVAGMLDALKIAPKSDLQRERFIKAHKAAAFATLERQ